MTLRTANAAGEYIEWSRNAVFGIDGLKECQLCEMAHLHPNQISSHALLKQINETHRKGLDVQENE